MMFPRTLGQLITQVRGIPLADFGLDAAHFAAVNGKKMLPWAVPAVVTGERAAIDFILVNNAHYSIVM